MPRHGARSLSELPPKTHKDTLDALVPERLAALLAQAHLNSSR